MLSQVPESLLGPAPYSGRSGPRGCSLVAAVTAGLFPWPARSRAVRPLWCEPSAFGLHPIGGPPSSRRRSDAVAMQVPASCGMNVPAGPEAAPAAPDPGARCTAISLAIYPIGAAGGAGSHAILVSTHGVFYRVHVPAGRLAWGFTGPAASSPSRSPVTSATRAIEGLTAPFALPWTGRSRDHADALPGVMLRSRALSWCEIAVPVTSPTMTMAPPPLIPASAPEAPAGFRGHLVAIGLGCRRGVLVL